MSRERCVVGVVFLVDRWNEEGMNEMVEDERRLELEVRQVGGVGIWGKEETPGMQVQFIAIERLLDNPYQSRMAIEEGLEELARTIGSRGFQGVLVARPDLKEPGMYQITAGHRRREAARLAGLRELPVVVQVLTNVEMAILTAIENLQRADLSPLEEGRLFDVMMKQVGMTQVEVADAIKKDRGYVRNRLRLAHAPSDVQAFVEAKPDSLRAVVYLLEIEKEAERAPVIEQLLQKTLKTDDLPERVVELKQLKEEKTGKDVRKSRQRQDQGVQPGLAVIQRRMEKLQMVLRMVGEYQTVLQETVMPITEVERELLEQIDGLLRRLAWR